MSEPTLRAAALDDVEPIANIWHAGWRDGHMGHVPEALHAHRSFQSFLERVPPRLPLTTVAALAERVLGFVIVHDDELEQIFVAQEARGGGTAAALLRHAEQQISARFGSGWLAVVEGNVRARRFYERNGWSDGGPLDYPAEISGGTLIVPCRRYEKAWGTR